MRTKTLPIPEGIEHIAAYQTPHCGSLAVLLCMLHKLKVGSLPEHPPRMESKILGGMLPHDVVMNLKQVSPCEAVLSVKTRQERLSFLRNKIDNKTPCALFVGTGAGHWITVWGYDGGGFYVYDPGKNAARKEDTLLTYYPDSTLHAMWGKPIPFLAPLLKLGRKLPDMNERLRDNPFTVIFVP